MQSLPASATRVSLRLRWIIFIILGYLALYTAWLLLGANSEGERLLVGNLALVFPGLAASLLAWQAQRRPAPAGLKRAWRLLFAGLLLWTASDLAWMSSEASHLPMFQVLTDILHVAGYPAIFAGLLIYPRQARRSFTRLRLVFEIAISSLAVLTLGWLVLIQPVLNNTVRHSISLYWSAAYPLADLFLLVVLVNFFVITQPRHLDNALKWAGVGLAALTTSDMIYSFWILQNPFQSGTIIDLGWAAGYIALGMGAFMPSNVGQVDDQPISYLHLNKSPRFWNNLEERLQTSFPLVATFVLGWYAILDWQIRGKLEPVGLVMTIILAIGLVARQGIVAGEMELQQYAMLVSSIAVPAFICNKKGQLKLVNPALLSSIGYEHNNDLHERSMFSLFAADTLPYDLLAASLDQGWSGEARLLRQDGSTFPVYLSLRPILRPAGERLALAGTAHDLSEQKRQQAALQNAYEQITSAHRQLEALNEQLEQKVDEKTRSLSEAYTQLEAQNRALQVLDELKTDFVSLVSHELRAPLTNINGGIELVLSQSKGLPQGTRQSLTLVQVEIRRLTHFVESILDLSALDAGRIPLHPAPLHLMDVVLPLRRQLESMPGAERVTWQIDPKLPLVIADDHALTSIFFHLIDNAIKYAPNGRITVSARAEDGCVFAQVADQGPGIPPAALPLIFDKFYRYHYGDAQTVYGHGLGLYMARRLLQAMNGEIRAENLVEGGAGFTFWLPIFEE